MLTLALLALGSTITLNAPYSGAIDYRLSVARPGTYRLHDLGWDESDAERHPVVKELLWSAASGGCACPAALTTNDVQAYFAWRSSLDPVRRAQAKSALVLLRQADLDAQEAAERAAVEKISDGPELLLGDDAAAPYMEIVYRR